MRLGSLGLVTPGLVNGPSASEAIDSGLIVSLGQTNTFKTSIRSFPSWPHSACLFFETRGTRFVRSFCTQITSYTLALKRWRKFGKVDNFVVILPVAYIFSSWNFSSNFFAMIWLYSPFRAFQRSCVVFFVETSYYRVEERNPDRPLAQLLSARYRCRRSGIRFPGRSNLHSVHSNGSPPLRRFFGAVLPRR